MTTTFSRRPIRAFARFADFPALGITLALSLAACGDSGDSAAPTASPSSGATQSAGDAPTGGNVTPGVTGEIAAVTGSIAQVQDGDSQTAVTWTDTTAFKARVAGTVDDITVGSCVVASAVFGGDDATSSTEGDESSATFAASTVQVSEPVDGECTGGFGGGFGGGAPGAGGGPGSGTAGGSADGTAGEPPAGTTDAGPDAAGGTPPAASNGTPPDGASGDAGSAQRPSFGGMAVGVVTSIGGDTVTVESSLPSGGPAADGAAATDGDAATGSGATSTTPATATFTVASDTSVTTTQDSSADAVIAGQCISATGDQDDSGTLAATTITISQPGESGCVSRPAGRGGAGGGRSSGTTQDGATGQGGQA